MKQEIEQGLHEKLCAYILGEADEAVRVEVEQALEASADLREERERLEKTIGLVQETMSSSEALPLSAVADVLSAARARRSRPWYVHRAWRMAAGFAVVMLGGYVVVRVVGSESENPAPFTYTIFGEARPLLERSITRAEPAPEARIAEEPPQGSVPADSSTLLAQAEKHTADERRLRELGHVSVSAESAPPASSPPVTVETLERLDSYYGVAKAEGKDKDLAANVQPAPEQPVEIQLGYFEKESARAVAPTDGTGAVGREAAPLAAHKWMGARAARVAPVNPSSAPLAGGGPATGGPGGPGVPFQERGRVALGEELRQSGALAGLGYLDGETRDHSDDFFLGKPVSLGDKLRALSPVERDEYIERECRRILTDCRRLPNERPRDMFFRFYGDSAFELAGLDPLSTFSVDVDTASYALARRYLNEGHIPEKAQVRTEEFVNYFKADVPAPTKGTFAIHADLAPSRFGGDARWMMRVVVRGREVQKSERKPLNLTFVVDVSGSMREQGRLELVKHSMRLLAGELDPRDSLAIVAFSSDARQILPMTSARQKGVIESAIYPLQPEGSTNAAAGLGLGYEIALANVNPEASNRVVLLSDGVANTGQTDQDKITEDVRRCREKGIYLNTIGVGMNNHNDVLLEQLADKGDGVCNYVDTSAEARRAIVDNFTGAFETIARDVKVQVEFDATQVLRYRLLGYENRAIADKDFRNDKIDAGEVGAGHQVTALYEIERTGQSSEKPLATVRLRWKAPRVPGAADEKGANEEANEIARPVSVSQQTSFEGAGPGYRRAVLVAQFAEILRRSVHARGDSLDDAIAEADKLRKEIQDPDFDELVVLMHKSRQLVLQALPACDDLCEAVDAVRRNHVLRCEHELLAKADSKWIEDLERQNADLEARIKDLIRRKIDPNVK